MPARGLIDTGPILALLDRNDPWHRPCVETISQLRLPLMTSAAVLAEVFHLIPDGQRVLEEAWTLVRSGATRRSSISRIGNPCTEIFTIDHDDFETYRIDGRRRFRVVPDRSARRT